MDLYTIILLALTGFTLIALITLLVVVIRLHRRITRFVQGSSGEDLEATIRELSTSVEKLTNTTKTHDKHLRNIEERLQTSVRGIGIVRFNPFRDMGGNQSFACALVTEGKKGVVISTLFSREKTSIFAKPIQEMGSPYELTKEEKQALAIAYENCEKKHDAKI